MKKLIFLLTIVIFCACVKDVKTELSEEQKSSITNEIMELTTNWANAHNNMDADGAIELWDSSPDLMFAENGEFFPSRDSIYNYLKGFYELTTSMDVKWKQRVIIPLSQNSASMSGYFHAHAVFASGDIFDINSMFTGIFIKKNNEWVLVHGHESFK